MQRPRCDRPVGDLQANRMPAASGVGNPRIDRIDERTTMNQLLIAELHRLGYDEFLRRATQSRGAPRRRRNGRRRHRE